MGDYGNQDMHKTYWGHGDFDHPMGIHIKLPSFDAWTLNLKQKHPCFPLVFV